MPNIIIDINKYVVYQHLPTAGFIAFEYKQVAKIKKLLSENGKIFHQIPAEERMGGQLLEKNAKGDFVLSGNVEVVKLQDLDHLPFLSRIELDVQKLFGAKG